MLNDPGAVRAESDPGKRRPWETPTLGNAELTRVVWSNTTCPDGTNSDNEKGETS